MLFISHSTANDKFVNKLAEELAIRGIQTWVDHRDMPAGSRWVTHLEKALLESTVMLLVLSQEAVQSSYVESEWHTFFNMGRKIIPLLLDDCDVPLFLRTFHQVDFRQSTQFKEQVELLLEVIPETSGKTDSSTGLLPHISSLQGKSQSDSKDLTKQDFLRLAQAVLENKSITLRAGTLQLILPIDEIILQYPLAKETIIGRSHRSAQFKPDIDLNTYTNSSMVSRRHATIYFKDNILYIQDNESSNGTHIGDIILNPHEYYPIPNYTLICLSRQFPILIRYQF